MKRATTEDQPLGWSAEQLWQELGCVQRDRQKVLEQRNEARDLARELLGHTGCGCFHQRLPGDHWLFDWETDGKPRG